jgi:hypothetical protein
MELGRYEESILCSSVTWLFILISLSTTLVSLLTTLNSATMMPRGQRRRGSKAQPAV